MVKFVRAANKFYTLANVRINLFENRFGLLELMVYLVAPIDRAVHGSVLNVNCTELN